MMPRLKIYRKLLPMIPETITILFINTILSGKVKVQVDSL